MRHGSNNLRWAVALLIGGAVLAACSGGDGDGVSESTTTVESVDEPAVATTVPDDTTTVPEGEGLEVVADCTDPAAETIDFGTMVSGEVSGESVFYCMVVPEGLTGFTVTLTGMTANADLYMGYGSIDVVMNGGFVGTEFWDSDNDGTDDDVIVVDPTAPILQGLARPGAYFIEVLGEPTPFTLETAAS